MTGVPVVWVSGAGALVVSALFLFRRRSALTVSLIPWRLVLLVAGLFIDVGALHAHGFDQAFGRTPY